MPERIWKTAEYTRLSRDDGDKAESNSITSQKEIIRDYVSKHPEFAIVREYVDDGYSGVSFERPGFKQLMEDIRAKKIDCIICKDLSRFARNYIDAGRYLEKIFPFMGVRFIAINGTYGSVATMDVGSTAYFRITYNATNYVVKDGEATQITSYTITDTPDGFSIDKDSVVVKVGNKTLDNKEYTVSVDKTNGAMTITIPWVDDKGASLYTSPSDVEITYTATLTDKNAAKASSNKATIKYNDTEIPDVPGTEVYNYKIVIDKYDSSNKNTKLQGAEFVLKNNDGKFCKVGENGVVTWVDDQASATVVTTGENGAASFIGLKAGTYTLVETKAPAGYNLGENQTITLDNITEKLTDTKSLTVTEEIANSAGSTLPTTGGMGTTLLYTVGTLLVLGAGVTLVVRRRMNADK